MSRTFVFVGVTTGSSAINAIFPRWRDALGLPPDAEIAGVDLEPGAPAEAYRRTVAWIRDDPDVLGALVTTHKLDLLRAARDLFDELDPLAELLQEVSCIAVRDGRVLGWARDPVTAELALDDMLGKDAQVDDVLCMGSGGAAAAISLVLFERGARRLTLTDRNPERLALARALHAAVPHAATEVEYVLVDDGGMHDRLLARLRPGALVVNATGLGKDRPGTPLGAGAAWPEAAVAWELNYRGELEFLAQARAAGVRAEDGWRYFIFGWTAVMELVFQRPIGAGDIERLAEAAAFARPGGTT